MHSVRCSLNTLCCFIVLFIISVPAQADRSDYIFPDSSPSFSNYGTIGLLNMPSARFMPEGSIAFSWNRMQPYLRGSIVASPFNWLEASYGYTDINNILYSGVKAFSGGQSYKDKGFSFKVKILSETSQFPALAIGARDAAGTGWFSSEFIVASKKFGFVDTTVGLGWGFLDVQAYKNPFAKIDPSFNQRGYVDGTQGGEFNINSFFSGPMGIFAGVEVFLPYSKGARLKFEYDSTDYDAEAFQSVKQESRFNVGLSYPLTDKFSIKLGMIRGNTINIGFTLKSNFFDTKKGVKKFDPPKKIKNPSIYKKLNAVDRNLYRTSLKFLGEEGIYMQSAHIDKQEKTFEVAYAQNKYTSYVRAAGRAFNTLDSLAPESIEKIKLTNINAELGLNTIVLDRNKVRRNKDKPLVKGYTLSEHDMLPALYDINNYDFKPLAILPKHIYKIAPSLRSQIGGPDGFFFGDLRLKIKSELIFKKNLTLTTAISTGIYSNYDQLKLASSSILPHVRTDIVEYLKESEEVAIETLQLNYYSQLSDSLYTKFTAGYLEPMFFGAGNETLFRPFYSNLAIGMEVWKLQQRNYNQRMGLRDYKTTSGFVNLYYYNSPTGVLVALKGGKFLAKDSGIKLNLSRVFKSGLRMGVFATKSDISRAEFGEGSFDKGFYFFIPIESFFTSYSKGFTGFGLRPITRDGGATLNTQYSLWNVTDQSSAYNIERNWRDLYE